MITKKTTYLNAGVIFCSLLLMLSLITLTNGVASAATAKKASHTNYDDCLTVIKRVDDLSKLRNKYTANAVDKRITKLGELKAKVNKVSTAKLPQAHKDLLTGGIDKDAQTLKAFKDNRSTDVQVLRTNYCKSIYETQIYQYRGLQIASLIAVDSVDYLNNKFSEVFNHSYNTNVNSSMKTDIDAKLNEARALINANKDLVKSATDNIVNSQKNGTSHNLQKPDVKAMKRNLDNAYRKYTEASAIRKAASKISRDRQVSLVSVELKDSDSKTLAAGENGRKARKATVVVKVAGEGNRTINLSRQDSIYKWNFAEDKANNKNNDKKSSDNKKSSTTVITEPR